MTQTKEKIGEVMRKNLEIIKQHILQSDENIEKTGVWLAYLKIVEYIKNTKI